MPMGAGGATEAARAADVVCVQAWKLPRTLWARTQPTRYANAFGELRFSERFLGLLGFIRSHIGRRVVRRRSLLS